MKSQGYKGSEEEATARADGSWWMAEGGTKKLEQLARERTEWSEEYLNQRARRSVNKR